MALRIACRVFGNYEVFTTAAPTRLYKRATAYDSGRVVSPLLGLLHGLFMAPWPLGYLRRGYRVKPGSRRCLFIIAEGSKGSS